MPARSGTLMLKDAESENEQADNILEPYRVEGYRGDEQIEGFSEVEEEEDEWEVAVKKLSDLQESSSASGSTISVDMNLLQESSSSQSSIASSIIKEFALKRSEKMKKYSTILVRAVRRQVLFNNYKKDLYK